MKKASEGMSNKLLGVAIVLFVILIYKHIELLHKISQLIETQSSGVRCLNGNSAISPGTSAIGSVSSGNYSRPTQRMIEMYKRQVESRQTNLAKTVAGSSSFARIYNNLGPEVYCSELVKVGTTDDGGKWMCAPHNIPKDCAIFSLGLNNEISFEEDIQGFTNQRCSVYGFDSAEQSPGVAERLSKIKTKAMAAKITKKTNEAKKEYTIGDLMKMNNVDKIEILKIDIERSEFDVMEDFLNQNVVSQIMIEVHGKPHQTLEFLRMMARKGYYLFHYEINGEYHQLCEYAFIHESVLDRYGATLLARFLI